MHRLSKQQLAWSERGSTPSNLFKQVHRLSKQQLAWSECSSTHSNISEPVQSLSKQQKEQAARSSTHSNLSKRLHSLSKQQLAWSERGSTHSSSNYYTGVLCSGCAEVQRGSSESNLAQTALTHPNPTSYSTYPSTSGHVPVTSTTRGSEQRMVSELSTSIFESFPQQLPSPRSSSHTAPALYTQTGVPPLLSTPLPQTLTHFNTNGSKTG